MVTNYVGNMSETVVIPTASCSVMAGHFVSMVEPALGYFDPTYFDNTYFDVSTPTVAITDSLARTYGANRTMTETKSISEALSAMVTALRGIAETTIISDSLARIAGFFRNISDPQTFFDPAYFDPAYFDQGGSYPITDSVARQEINVINIIESAISALDSVVVQSAFGRAVIEVALSIFDSVSRLLSALRGIAEAITEPALFDPAYFDPAYFDAGGAGPIDTVKANANMFRSMSDTPITDSDSLARTYSAKRVMQELNAISDSLARIVHLSITIPEPALHVLDTVVGTVIPFAIKRLKTASAYIGKRLTSAFVGKRTTSGAVE